MLPPWMSWDIERQDDRERERGEVRPQPTLELPEPEPLRRPVEAEPARVIIIDLYPEES